MSTTTWFAPFLRPAPAAFEQWLETKAADGQILTRCTWLSPIRMTFTESAPTRVRYVVERRANPAPIDYFRFREAQGWEHVGNVSDLHVWSRAYSGERPGGFIGDDLARRASLLGVGLSVIAAVTLVAAVAMGATALVVGSSAALWVPAIVLGVIGVAALLGAAAFTVSERWARNRASTPPRARVDA